ncbi:MAG: Asp23/Gls24 family envelope stress response protein [Lachnospiraceae bacterium]|nr:Asp23/Gls24 family envelope stress response protein [Lachnospiraceae bacterium]MDE7176641.1 Asp23/Gls24 family envelope stress response protein [Lachnospiraceae bacterium]
MEQEAEKNGYELQAERAGTVRIADDVVAMIAALAATEVEGIAAMAGNLTNELLSRVGVRGLSRGARVEVSEGKVKAELAVVMEYGYNIPATCQKVQTKVKNAIENMTGLEVQDVNIRIAGINVTREK